MRVAVDPFDIDLPAEWAVVMDGFATGVVVLDPLPGESGLGMDIVQPNVALRYYSEDSGGGVLAAAPRELFAQHALRGAVLLEYAANWTQSGLPVRRHHVVVRAGDRPVHSLRWYVGAAQDVLELTLTFNAGWLPRQLWEVTAEGVQSARAPLAGAPVAEVLSLELEDPQPGTVLTEEHGRLTLAESLGRV